MSFVAGISVLQEQRQLLSAQYETLLSNASLPLTRTASLYSRLYSSRILLLSRSMRRLICLSLPRSTSHFPTHSNLFSVVNSAQTA